MSEENVEIVRRQWELWSEGDFDGWAAFYDPGVIVIAPEGWPEGAVSEGLDAWRLQGERLRDNWQDAHVEVEEIRPIGDDRVFAQIRYVTRGSDPGMSFDTPMGVVTTLKAGKIIRAEYFWDVADALRAAGE